MSKLRFVVLGDSHFCPGEIRQIKYLRKFLGETGDEVRYCGMAAKVLAPLLKKIKSLKPDLLISTGDFVEGGMGDQKKTSREMYRGWELLREVGCPVIIAKGTHEDAEAFRKIIVPAISALNVGNIDREYFSCDYGGNVFFILDYKAWGSDNNQHFWLERKIAEIADKAKHIFIVAHPPLYSWGRHFFYESEFIVKLNYFCRKYPVDAYLCGHTHNQSVSFHGINNSDRGFLQIMASSVGYPDMGAVPLGEFHTIPEFTAEDRMLWGICEDSAPGFYLFETMENKLDVQWFSVEGNHGRFMVNNRCSSPEIISMPTFRTYTNILEKCDLHQIIGGWFYCYGFCENSNNTKITLNDIPIGVLPHNPSYAARRYLPLPQDVLLTIARENNVELTLPKADNFVIGSISLEVLLYDGRKIHTKVVPEIFICGNKWDKLPMPHKIHRVKPGTSIKFQLDFL